MQFNSLEYVFMFLPVVVTGWIVLRGSSVANLFILCASLYFYASSAVWYLAPLLVTALLDYFVGRRVSVEERPGARRALTGFSVVCNLALLSFFKYVPWVTSRAAGLGLAVPVIAVGLPPAISFYTFQSMSYTIDIYRREFKPNGSVINYLSFVTFFPHLVAGPIMRARDLLPQLASDRPLPTWQNVSMALFMILFGIFQKVVVADNVAAVVDDISKQLSVRGSSIGPGLGLIYAYGFAIQIYCDFAAYSTIARGSAKLFNVDLMRNFATPYFASSPSEFWRRWHISFSTWLRDYLYIPLGGNRGGAATTYRNLMLTMVIGGLWHGAGTLFVIWGFWHGLLLIAYRLAPIDKSLAGFGRSGRLIAIILFFHLVCIGWVFFRSAPYQIGPIFTSILSTPGAFEDPHSNAAFWASLKLIALFWTPMLLLDFAGWRRGGEFIDVFSTLSSTARIAISLSLIYAIIFFARRQASDFIYFAF